MAGVKDDELLRFEGFPGGIDNVSTETAVGPGHLREAVNTDLRQGKPKRRKGYALVLAGSAHSLWPRARPALCGRMFAWHEGSLVAFDNAELTPIELATGLPEDREVSFDETDDATVWWSNGDRIGRVDPGALTASPLWPSHPGQPHVAAAANGGLSAGTYQVAITYRDSFGRESGSSLAELVTLTEGQGIALTGIPANPEAATVEVYVTQADSETLFHARTLPEGTTSATIGTGQRVRELATQFLEPMPAGQIVRAFNGRLLVARGRHVYFSEPFRYGLRAPESVIGYAPDVALVEPIGRGPESGCYVGDRDRTYFMAGPDAATWAMLVAYGAGAVPNTAIQVPPSLLGLEEVAADTVPVWLTTNGRWAAGLPGGLVRPLTEDVFLAPSGAASGAALLRETNGMRQLLLSVRGGGMKDAAILGDSMVATVRRHGSTTT